MSTAQLTAWGPDEFRAAADEAKRHGLAFAGHVPTLVSVDEALTLGMASIEHLQMFTTACSSQEESLRATLLAAVMLHEHLSVNFVLGFVAVVTGVMIVNWTRSTNA